MKRSPLLHFLIPTLALCAVLWLPASSAAQSVTSYQLRVYLAGAASPLTTFDFAAGAVTCGQPKAAASATVTNPTTVAWDDPGNAALDCRWTDTGTGPLFALPFSVTNTYTSALVAINAAGASAESARSNPFSRPGSPAAAPVNVRLVRP